MLLSEQGRHLRSVYFAESFSTYIFLRVVRETRNEVGFIGGNSSSVFPPLGPIKAARELELC
jgi:hypothetical protein